MNLRLDYLPFVVFALTKSAWVNIDRTVQRFFNSPGSIKKIHETTRPKYSKTLIRTAQQQILKAAVKAQTVMIQLIQKKRTNRSLSPNQHKAKSPQNEGPFYALEKQIRNLTTCVSTSTFSSKHESMMTILIWSIDAAPTQIRRWLFFLSFYVAAVAAVVLITKWRLSKNSFLYSFATKSS